MTDSSVLSPGRGDEPRNAVAVLGTGIMGSAMARNLARCRAAHDGVGPVAAGDRAARRRGRRGSARHRGTAVADAGVVITMLPTAEVVDSVIFADGVADALADGACGRRWARSASRRRCAT